MTAAVTDSSTRSRQPHPTNQSPPDYILNGRLFSRLTRRNRARILFGLHRIRRGLDLGNAFDVELADAIDVETDRLSSLMRGIR